MKASSMKIKGLDARPMTKHPNKGQWTSDKKRYQIVVPVLNIIFADDPSRAVTPAAQAAALREVFKTVNRFFRENSYGGFEFLFRLRTAFLDQPKSWRGNLEGVTPKYKDGKLSNAEKFVASDEYTGFEGFVVQRTEGEADAWLANYNASAERNFAMAALAAAAQGPAYPYDDPGSFEDWIGAGIPNGNAAGATLMFCSRSLANGGTRTFKVYLSRKKGEDLRSRVKPVTIGNRILYDYVFIDTEIDWRVYTHELSHVLGAVDLYNREVKNGVITNLSDAGYLGPVSQAGGHNDAHLDAFLKFRFDWLDPEIVDPGRTSRTIDLPPVYGAARNAVLIRPDAQGHPDEFYLLEVRHPSGQRFDGHPIEFDQELAAEHRGLLIYHVNAVRATGASKASEVAKAQPQIDLEGESPGSAKLVAFGSGGEFAPPASDLYDGYHSGLTVKVLSVKSDGTHRVAISWGGIAEFCAVGADGKTRSLRIQPGWRQTWSELVAGDFTGDGGSELLLYDRGAGEASFLRVSAEGRSAVSRHHTGWRKSWSILVPGNFNGAGATDLLLYDRAAGEAEFHAVDGKANLVLVKKHTGWRKTWTAIVAGNFGGGATTDLLFYDRSSGEAEFHASDGKGGMTLLARHTGWRKTWSQIVAGNFGGGGTTDLLLYDATTGEAEFHMTDGRGGMRLLQRHTGWRKTWSQIVAANFNGSGAADLLFYDGTAGEGEFHATDGRGGMSLLRKHTGWRKTWSAIVAGDFNGAGARDLLFYDPGTT